MDPRRNDQPQPSQAPIQNQPYVPPEPASAVQNFQQPQTPHPFVEPVLQQPSGSKRSFITTGRIVLLTVLVAVGLITLLLVSIFSVSKADYNEADRLVDAMREDYISINSSNYSLGSTMPQEVVTDNLKILKQSRTSLNERFTELGTQKAIVKDSDLQEQYKAIEKRKPAYDDAVDVAVESYEKILPATSEFQSQINISDQDPNAPVTALKEAFESIDELQSENNKKFVAKVITIAKSSDSDASLNIQKAILDWQTGLVQLFDSVNIGEEINTLNDSTYAKFEGKY